MDEDQGDGVGIGRPFGDREATLQAALAEPYGEFAAAGPGGWLLTAAAGR
ncbi:hypothetical protein [Streptomyces hundungensis]